MTGTVPKCEQGRDETAGAEISSGTEQNIGWYGYEAQVDTFYDHAYTTIRELITL